MAPTERRSEASALAAGEDVGSRNTMRCQMKPEPGSGKAPSGGPHLCYESFVFERSIDNDRYVRRSCSFEILLYRSASLIPLCGCGVRVEGELLVWRL